MILKRSFVVVTRLYKYLTYFLMDVVIYLLTCVVSQVMGLAVLGDLLYVVYHKQSTIYMYNRSAPYHPASTADMVVLKWPRGMAASKRHRSIYVTDWCSMFTGRLWCIVEKVQQVQFLSTSLASCLIYL